MGKALEARARPQKQLSQPTLGANEYLERGGLRSSQSSEGSELMHSSPHTTSPPNSASYSPDTSRDVDFGVPSGFNWWIFPWYAGESSVV